MENYSKECTEMVSAQRNAANFIILQHWYSADTKMFGKQTARGNEQSAAYQVKQLHH